MFSSSRIARIGLLFVCKSGSDRVDVSPAMNFPACMSSMHCSEIYTDTTPYSDQAENLWQELLPHADYEQVFGQSLS